MLCKLTSHSLTMGLFLRVAVCVAVCCSVCGVLQHVAACCIMLLCVAACCSVVERGAACCSVLHQVAACCSVLRRAAACCSILQRAAACYSVLQHIAACCSKLQISLHKSATRSRAHLRKETCKEKASHASPALCTGSRLFCNRTKLFASPPITNHR